MPFIGLSAYYLAIERTFWYKTQLFFDPGFELWPGSSKTRLYSFNLEKDEAATCPGFAW